MLTLEQRAELLVFSESLAQKKAYAGIADLLSPLNELDLISEPWLGCQLAKAKYRLGDLAGAWDLLQKLTEPCSRRGSDRVYRLRLNLEGALLLEYGKTSAAELAFQRLAKSAEEASDHADAAWAMLNLGTAAAIRGDWAKAQSAYLHAKPALDRQGLVWGIAACHQNLGIVQREMGNLTDADSSFEHAFELHSEIDSQLDIAATEYERALVYHVAGNSRHAEALARRAMDRIDRLDESRYGKDRHTADALRVIAIILTRLKKWSEAENALEHALTLAERTRSALLKAEVYDAMAQLAKELGGIEESTNCARQAIMIYREIGAEARAEGTLRLLETGDTGPNP